MRNGNRKFKQWCIDLGIPGLIWKITWAWKLWMLHCQWSIFKSFSANSRSSNNSAECKFYSGRGLNWFSLFDWSLDQFTYLRGVPYYKTKSLWKRFITWMDMYENPIIKHSISVRKSNREFANPIIKHLNSSKILL